MFLARSPPPSSLTGEKRSLRAGPIGPFLRPTGCFYRKQQSHQNVGVSPGGTGVPLLSPFSFLIFFRYPHFPPSPTRVEKKSPPRAQTVLPFLPFSSCTWGKWSTFSGRAESFPSQFRLPIFLFFPLRGQRETPPLFFMFTYSQTFFGQFPAGQAMKDSAFFFPPSFLLRCFFKERNTKICLYRNVFSRRS